MRDERMFTVDSWDEFCDKIKSQPGFYRVPWGGDGEDEDRVKDATKATIRCFPLVQDSVEGLMCPLTGKPAKEWAIFARAY